MEKGISTPWPLFSGETSLEEWKRCLQENIGPWGELATDNIILTVPTANLRTLDNPEPVLRLWDEVMQAVARLGAEPFPLRLPQRIVADVQISVGGCPVPSSPVGLLSPKGHALGSQQGKHAFLARQIRCNPCYLNEKEKCVFKKKIDSVTFTKFGNYLNVQQLWNG